MPSVKVQLRIYERQNGVCACGCQVVMDFDRDEIDCDHIVALKDHGENRETNLQLLRRKCHRTKTAAENTARADANRHKAKALTSRKKSSFKTNRDGPFKKRMDGTLINRKTGELA
jgi:5-methylcytosine-specific restriction endonuclease McrA